MYEEKELKWFDRQGVKRPEHASHGATPDNLSEKIRKLDVRNWRLEGNILKGDTDMGPFAQTIPTTHILEGVDEQGLPKFRRVDIT